jgi:hypothetical protein
MEISHLKRASSNPSGTTEKSKTGEMMLISTGIILELVLKIPELASDRSKLVEEKSPKNLSAVGVRVPRAPRVTGRVALRSILMDMSMLEL